MDWFSENVNNLNENYFNFAPKIISLYQLIAYGQSTVSGQPALNHVEGEIEHQTEQ